ncbi:hypothetical protein M758_10G146200 [Ceratodon purpureus]|uniref:Regucalcin n=1 Tax=Ceratodon purpureus TaxID=3225 RepID=A0A8T0GPC5_CERPU|nr:hypothetical protein KC19_10G151700 [Ceratodon purpureus]KAG0604114.1 hypothetical protein M758_10G146200 [Ceratodon purpureus]
MAKVELAMDIRCSTGESPVSYASGNVHFVDIEGCMIHAFDTVANRPVGGVSTNGRMVGNVVPCASPGLPGFDLLACVETSILPVNFYGNDVSGTYVASVPDSDLNAAKPIRFNDGKVDFQGRLWAGTMAMDPEQNPESGRLYCLERGKSLNGGEKRASYDLVEKISPVGISNGTEWYGQHMYYIDSLQPEVCVFDFDEHDGSISNRRRVLHIPDTQGLPDGMTIDANGKLWVALFGGSSIVQIDPETQTELMTIQVPALCPTSMAFGGKDLSELYVTSGGSGEEKKGGNSEHRGGLFRVHVPGVKGLSFSRAFTQ